jgi:hypothetical protein
MNEKNWRYELSNDVEKIESHRAWLLGGQREITGWELHLRICGIDWRLALLQVCALERLELQRERERERESED